MKCEAVRGFWLQDKPFKAGEQADVPDHLVPQLVQSGKIKRLPPAKAQEPKAEKQQLMTAAANPALVPPVHKGEKHA